MTSAPGLAAMVVGVVVFAIVLPWLPWASIWLFDASLRFWCRLLDWFGRGWTCEETECEREGEPMFIDGWVRFLCDEHTVEAMMAQTTQCGNCGAERFTWEQCSECGSYGGRSA